MYRNNLTSLLFAALAAFSGNIQALPEDVQQEMTILSNSAELDRKAGLVVYKGNVVLTQGTLKIESDRLLILRNGNVLEKAVAEGKPARFQQQISADQGITHAEGDRIDYFAVRKEVHLSGNARMEQERNEFSGEKITYDMANEKVVAKSSLGNGSAEKTGKRIKVVIQPETREQNGGVKP